MLFSVGRRFRYFGLCLQQVSRNKTTNNLFADGEFWSRRRAHRNHSVRFAWHFVWLEDVRSCSSFGRRAVWNVNTYICRFSPTIVSEPIFRLINYRNFLGTVDFGIVMGTSIYGSIVDVSQRKYTHSGIGETANNRKNVYLIYQFNVCKSRINVFLTTQNLCVRHVNL